MIFLLGKLRLCIIGNINKNVLWFACSTWKSNLRCTTLNRKRGKLGSLFSYLEGYGMFFLHFHSLFMFDYFAVHTFMFISLHQPVTKNKLPNTKCLLNFVVVVGIWKEKKPSSLFSFQIVTTATKNSCWYLLFGF